MNQVTLTDKQLELLKIILDGAIEGAKQKLGYIPTSHREKAIAPFKDLKDAVDKAEVKNDNRTI